MKKLINFIRHWKRRYEFRKINIGDVFMFSYYDEDGNIKLRVGILVRINSNGSFYVKDILENENNYRVFDKYTEIIAVY